MVYLQTDTSQFLQIVSNRIHAQSLRQSLQRLLVSERNDLWAMAVVERPESRAKQVIRYGIPSGISKCLVRLSLCQLPILIAFFARHLAQPCVDSSFRFLRSQSGKLISRSR